jgi:antitoxin component YwqK of YwqJK toxin-antitoxin module
MKTASILMIALSAMIGCSADPVDYSTLDQRDGLYYEVNSSEPFTGRYISYFDDNETIKGTGSVSRGVWHGRQVVYHTNGQIRFEGNMKDGQGHGINRVYYDTGQLETKGRITLGKQQGEWIDYYPDGSVKWKSFFVDDKEVSGYWSPEEGE